MTALLAALATAALLGGLLLVAVGLRAVPVDELADRPASARAGRPFSPWATSRTSLT